MKKNLLSPTLFVITLMLLGMISSCSNNDNSNSNNSDKSSLVVTGAKVYVANEAD